VYAAVFLVNQPRDADAYPLDRGTYDLERLNISRIISSTASVTSFTDERGLAICVLVTMLPSYPQQPDMFNKLSPTPMI
jgi:hypothetical protein